MLTSNPFCTRWVRPGAVAYQFPELDGRDPNDTDTNLRLAQIVARLQRHRCGLLVGPHGSGKSTLLQTLRPFLDQAFTEIENIRLSAAGSDRLRDRYGHLRLATKRLFELQNRLPSGGLLVVDGAEQLWRFHLARLNRIARRRGQAVLATSHSPIGGMPVLYRTVITPELVIALTEKLLAETTPGVARVVRAELGRREWSRLTNVRDLWFDLYDVVQPYVVPPTPQPTPPE